MVQEFHVVRCFSCEAYQVDQVKRSTNKWSCRVCNEKQSLKQVYFKGSGKECRIRCQELNMSRMHDDIQERQNVEELSIDPSQAVDDPGLLVTDQLYHEQEEDSNSQKSSKWSKFINCDDEHEKDAKDKDPSIKVCFRGEFTHNRLKRKHPSHGKLGKSTKSKINNNLRKISLGTPEPGNKLDESFLDLDKPCGYSGRPCYEPQVLSKNKTSKLKVRQGIMEDAKSLSSDKNLPESKWGVEGRWSEEEDNVAICNVEKMINKNDNLKNLGKPVVNSEETSTRMATVRNPNSKWAKFLTTDISDEEI